MAYGELSYVLSGKLEIIPTDQTEAVIVQASRDFVSFPEGFTEGSRRINMALLPVLDSCGWRNELFGDWRHDGKRAIKSRSSCISISMVSHSCYILRLICCMLLHPLCKFFWHTQECHVCYTIGVFLVNDQILRHVPKQAVSSISSTFAFSNNGHLRSGACHSIRNTIISVSLLLFG